MSTWAAVEQARCFGVVKWNFEAGLKNSLQVLIGDTVHIRGETADWYLCTRISDGEAVEDTGIVPKSYVHVQESYVLPIGDGHDSLVIPRRPPLVQEITDAIREWHKVSKQRFVIGRVTIFQLVKGLIFQLHNFRSSITSPELTVDGRRELRKQVAECIDYGNSILKLDMSVRDEAGNALNPQLTSAVELYRQHHKTQERLDKKQVQNAGGVGDTKTLCIAVKCERITWTVVDECQVRFYLYDADEDAVFTECGLLQLNTNTNHNQTLLKSTRFLFTDLSSLDTQRSRVYLIAYVVRIGALLYRPDKSNGTVGGHQMPFSHRAGSGIPVRRPWGLGARDITHLLKNTSKGGDGNELSETFPFVPFLESDSSLKSALIKCVEGSANVKQNTVDNGSFQCLVNVLFNVRPDSVGGTEILTGDGVNGFSAFDKLGDGTTTVSVHDLIVRKMGFPEVIRPNDVRNEMYVRLSFGEFSRGSKTSDKNVQVTMSCHNERGELISGILFSGNKSGTDTYNSVVYYHDDKPKWFEIVKVSLPMVIEEFSSTHLKFTFKHRSTSDSKDKTEKPFALAYLKLRADKGTAMPDGEHRLRVYKIDGKQYRDTDVSYLALPSLAPVHPATAPLKSPNQVFSWSLKDSFSIRTILCSTKFTQNVHLLELLQWSSKSQAVSNDAAETNERKIHLGSILLQELNRIMSNVICVPDTEIVKFLPDVFDALFYVLVKPIEAILQELNISWTEDMLHKFVEIKNICDRTIFDCLIYIFEVVLNPKYQKFKSVLAHYIEDGFTATLAYKQLIRELEHSFRNPVADKVLKIMKSFEWFFKFIIRSFSVRLQLERMNPEVIEQEGEVEAEAEFEHLIVNLFDSITKLVARTEGQYLAAQGAVLRYLPSIIESLSTVLSPLKLSELLVDLLRWVHPQQLAHEKLGTIGEIVRSSLFRNTYCRTTLQPIIMLAIREHLPGNDNDMRRRMNETTKIKSKNKITQTLGAEAQRPVKIPETLSHLPATMKCVELLSDMMDTLFRPDIGPIEDNITFIMHVLLQPLIQSIATIGDKDPVSGNMVAILLSLFRQMGSKHYLKFIGNLRKKPNANGELELATFINELLVTLKSLTLPTCSIFPATWAEMVRLQNSIILTVLKHFSMILKSEYSDEETFVMNIWHNFFSCLVSFASQNSLCLELASRVKRVNILNFYGDMRRTAAELTHQMWFSLGQSKRLRFVPQMVGMWLQMGFVHDAEIQKAVITILFDMMRCEFDEAVTLSSLESQMDPGTRNSGDGSAGKGMLKMEDELVKRLVELIESGHGDSTFGAVFRDTMFECCKNDNSGLQQLGMPMIEMLTRLIDLLLEYRSVIIESEIGNTMSCIVNLLDFSMEIGRKELYLRYLYKLHELHVKSGNFTEAAFTLRLHSRQLDWTEEECPPHLRSPLQLLLLCQSQWEMKEALYYEIINYFDKAKMWECALEICDELRSQYADETYNYALLSPLLQRMSSFYNSILKGVRCDPEYFRVAFFGTQFPLFLQDKAFVYRGKEYEKLSEFEARMLERFPKAELLRSLNRPSEEIRTSGKQYLQICKVDPIMNTGLGAGNRLSGMKYADESIRKYYRSNNVNKFSFSRPYHREPKDPTNEFASLWLDRYTLWTSNSFPGIMNWFPIIKECSEQVKPIVKAIETMEEVNDKLREMVLVHSTNPNEDLGSLTMKLSGILDAAVMGGISNYESAFLSPAYLEREPQDTSLVDRLKTLICNQVPIVYQCLLIHERKAPESLADLHRHLQGCYNNLVEHMTKVYGVSLKNVQDESLTRDVERATRRKKAQSRRHEEAAGVIPISSDFVQPRHGHVHNQNPHPHPHAPGLRNKGSVSSSTMSLYSSGFVTKMSKAKQRRSTQSSLDEHAVHQAIQMNSASAGGFHHSASNNGLGSMSKLYTTANELHSSGHDLHKSRDSGLSGSFYPLQEQSQGAMSASVLENRRSFTWAQHSPGPGNDSGGGNRNSAHSLTSTISEMPQPLQAGTTTNSSSTSMDSSSQVATTTETEVEEEMVPPPLPPKSHNQNQQGEAEPVGNSSSVPPKPPPKPPLRRFQQ